MVGCRPTGPQALGSQEFPLRPDAFSRWSCSADINGQAIGRRRFRLPRVLERAVRQPFSRDSRCSICRCFQTLGPATGSRTPRSDQPRSARPTQLTALANGIPCIHDGFDCSLLPAEAGCFGAPGLRTERHRQHRPGDRFPHHRPEEPPAPPTPCVPPPLRLFGSWARKRKPAANWVTEQRSLKAQV